MEAECDILLLDGATGTELGRRDVDISLPLWSARAIDAAPETLGAVHEAYLEAGSAAITTCTFRTHERSVAKGGWAGRGQELTTRAVEIARLARQRARPEALVLGSVAPLEDCYQPALAPDEATCVSEHTAIVEHLCEAGVDAILIETMGTLRETRAAITAALRAGASFWVCFCTARDASPGTLLSGEPIAELADDLAAAATIGINCMAAPEVAEQVRTLRSICPGVPIAAYANIGYARPDGSWATTDAVDPARYAEYARGWHAAGATRIGGCCGTRPEHVRAIADRLDVVR